MWSRRRVPDTGLVRCGFRLFVVIHQSMFHLFGELKWPRNRDLYSYIVFISSHLKHTKIAKFQLNLRRWWNWPNVQSKMISTILGLKWIIKREYWQMSNDSVMRYSSVNIGGARHFWPKIYVWKFNKMPEFYMIFDRKNISPISGGGVAGWRQMPSAPVATPMDSVAANYTSAYCGWPLT